jgi:hypothetical protein
MVDLEKRTDAEQYMFLRRTLETLEGAIYIEEDVERNDLLKEIGLNGTPSESLSSVYDILSQRITKRELDYGFRLQMGGKEYRGYMEDVMAHQVFVEFNAKIDFLEEELGVHCPPGLEFMNPHEEIRPYLLHEGNIDLDECVGFEDLNRRKTLLVSNSSDVARAYIALYMANCQDND